MLFVVPRVVWGARSPRSTVDMKLPVSELWIHHTAGASPPDLPQTKVEIEKRGERANMKAIQNYHMDDPDHRWVDIAYNFVIMPSGRVYKGRGWNRQGAHTEGHNDHAVAFCFAGNFDIERPTEKALKSARLLRARGQRYSRLAKTVRVGGHRDASGAQTACPGKHLYSRIGDIR